VCGCKPVPRAAEAESHHAALLGRQHGAQPQPVVWRRKLKMKAKVESIISHFSIKRLVPGGFNMGFVGSTCTALPLVSLSFSSYAQL